VAASIYVIPSELFDVEAPRQDHSLPISLGNGRIFGHHAGAVFLATAAQRDGFVLLVAFLVTFLFIRTSARLIRLQVSWWPGNVETAGGLHIHHLVWGICLVLISGFLSIAVRPSAPWGEILAAGFGIGMGLTLDEFALWLRLEDVYWAKEGRASLDAVIVAALVGGLIVLGLSPIDATHNTRGWSILIGLSLNLAVCAIAILKGRLLLGLIGVFVPLVSLVAAVRLAAPSSPWARWFYRPGSHRQSRCQERFARARTRHARIMDLIGGAPSTAVATEAAVDAASAATGAAIQIDEPGRT
jgi:hypothetical protein